MQSVEIEIFDDEWQRRWWAVAFYDLDGDGCEFDHLDVTAGEVLVDDVPAPLDISGDCYKRIVLHVCRRFSHKINAAIEAHAAREREAVFCGPDQ